MSKNTIYKGNFMENVIIIRYGEIFLKGKNFGFFEKTLVDNIKAMGYKYSTRSSISIAIYDMRIPPEKKQILADAQAKGYAEANPAADVLGTDACRKITILTALATDKLYDVTTVHTEGITGIRKADVLFAERENYKIKLLGRCIAAEGREFIMVAPFLLPSDSPLSTVSGVYNAVEVVAEPLGNVMFYGQGAGAGATASAGVGDLLPIIAYGNANPIKPGFNRVGTPASDSFGDFESRKYVAFPTEYAEKVQKIFAGDEITISEECVILTGYESEKATDTKIASIGVEPLSKIRFL